MNKSSTIVVTAIVVVLSVALVLEHQSRTSLREEVLSLTLEVERLQEEVAASNKPNRSAVQAPPPEQTANLQALEAQIAELRARQSDFETANATVSSLVVSLKEPDIPFIYPDSTRRQDYTFGGYSSPQGAFQSVIWSRARLDPKAEQACLTGSMADAFARSLEDLPEGVMGAGYRNGMMYKATGYRVLDETHLPEGEVRLKVFLEGVQGVIKPVFKKEGEEWKWARNDM